jgi:hypothetical protein
MIFKKITKETGLYRFRSLNLYLKTWYQLTIGRSSFRIKFDQPQQQIVCTILY